MEGLTDRHPVFLPRERSHRLRGICAVSTKCCCSPHSSLRNVGTPSPATTHAFSCASPTHDNQGLFALSAVRNCPKAVMFFFLTSSKRIIAIPYYLWFFMSALRLVPRTQVRRSDPAPCLRSKGDQSVRLPPFTLRTRGTTPATHTVLFTRSSGSSLQRSPT